MTNIDAVIADLEKQQSQIKEKIDRAKKTKAKKESEFHKKRCAIIGDVVLKNAKSDAEFDALLKRILDGQVKKKTDRKILGLEETS